MLAPSRITRRFGTKQSSWIISHVFDLHYSQQRSGESPKGPTWLPCGLSLDFRPTHDQAAGQACLSNHQVCEASAQEVEVEACDRVSFGGCHFRPRRASAEAIVSPVDWCQPEEEWKVMFWSFKWTPKAFWLCTRSLFFSLWNSMWYTAA
jgi:hypothetical protein